LPGTQIAQIENTKADLEAIIKNAEDEDLERLLKLINLKQ